jgi:hypothetical protein
MRDTKHSVLGIKLKESQITVILHLGKKGVMEEKLIGVEPETLKALVWGTFEVNKWPHSGPLIVPVEVVNKWYRKWAWEGYPRNSEHTKKYTRWHLTNTGFWVKAELEKQGWYLGAWWGSGTYYTG